MDPATGEILAMANYPTFNPNAFKAATPEARKNRAVTDLYEPGSTFKIVTASAAIEEGVMTPNDLIDVSAGQISFQGRVVRDDHRYGVLTVRRRDREVEQRRRHQDRARTRRRAPRRLHQPLRLRPAVVERLPGREPRHRLESVEA